MKRILSALIAVFLFLSALSACGVKMPPNTVSSPGDVSGKQIGVLEGTAAARICMEYGEVCPYTDKDIMMRDLTLGTLDCAVTDASVADALASKTRGVKVLDEPLTVRPFSFAIAKENPELTRLVNESIAALSADGTIGALVDWFINGAGSAPVTDEPEGDTVLQLAASADFPPYVYEDADGCPAGLDIALARTICAKLGTRLEVVPISADKAVQTVQYGKAELALGGLSANEVDGAFVDFTSPYTTCTLKIIVRKA